MNLEDILGVYELVMEYFKVYDYPDQERIGYSLENGWTWYTGNITASEW